MIIWRQALAFVMADTLKSSDRVPFTFKNAHPFAFITFFRKSPVLRNIGLFSLLSEAPNFQGYEGLFQVCAPLTCWCFFHHATMISMWLLWLEFEVVLDASMALARSQIHKFGWMKRERTNLQIIRRSIHFFNFNFYEWMARNLGLTGTLRWGIRCTALEALVPGLIGRGYSKTTMGSIIGASIPSQCLITEIPMPLLLLPTLCIGSQALAR